MTIITPWFDAARKSDRQQGQLPETVQLTAATIRAWRAAGYRLSEQRRAGWLYFVARGHGESAVYQLVGPRFHGETGMYQAQRIA